MLRISPVWVVCALEDDEFSEFEKKLKRQFKAISTNEMERFDESTHKWWKITNVSPANETLTDDIDQQGHPCDVPAFDAPTGLFDLLSHLKEFDEPFESKQVGSSAMAYKRNPMRSERIASLSRYVIADIINPAITASAQWFERTLDDSANKRISVPEAFLAVDAILSLYINVITGGTIYPKVCEKHLLEELPYMATENILMHCVAKGGDRQALHEAPPRFTFRVSGTLS